MSSVGDDHHSVAPLVLAEGHAGMCVASDDVLAMSFVWDTLVLEKAHQDYLTTGRVSANVLCASRSSIAFASIPRFVTIATDMTQNSVYLPSEAMFSRCEIETITPLKSWQGLHVV